MNDNNPSMKRSRFVYNTDEQDTSRNIPRDSQAEAGYDGRRNDEIPFSRSDRNNSGRSDRRGDRQTGQSGCRDIEYNRRDGRNG